MGALPPAHAQWGSAPFGPETAPQAVSKTGLTPRSIFVKVKAHARSTPASIAAKPLVAMSQMAVRR